MCNSHHLLFVRYSPNQNWANKWSNCCKQQRVRLYVYHVPVPVHATNTNNNNNNCYTNRRNYKIQKKQQQRKLKQNKKKNKNNNKRNIITSVVHIAQVYRDILNVVDSEHWAPLKKKTKKKCVHSTYSYIIRELCVDTFQFNLLLVKYLVVKTTVA